MIPQYHRNQERQIRHRRVRAKVVGAGARPRLSIFCSNRYLYAQIIDDETGRTLVSISNLPVAKEAKVKQKSPAKIIKSASALGEALAVKAVAKKIKLVVFDRGGYRYIGRVKALADGARAGGLVF
ncbi:MAG: 50S ribosomal protein L18 [Candidatus Vogelbacteria bacterium]